MKKTTIIIAGQSFSVSIDTSRTYGNGRPAITLVEDDGLTFAVLSVNVPDVHLEPGEVIIKTYSEGEGMLEFLLHHKIVSEPKRWIKTGWVEIPVVDLLEQG